MKINDFNQMIRGGRVIDGNWSIDSAHRIRYKARDKKETFDFRATVLDAGPNALVLQVTEVQSDQTIVSSVLRLNGIWLLDPKNRIVFDVRKRHGLNDVLTFRGRWKVNDRHEVVYAWRRTQLKTKRKIEKELTFQGHWELSPRNVLTYSIKGSSNSLFRFRGAFQTKSLNAKKGQIRYQAGVEVEGRRRTQAIVLFGKWKLSHDWALAFEIEYRDGRKHAIVFEAKYRVDGRNRLSARLKNVSGSDTGLELVFTHEFMKDAGEIFLRLCRSLAEKRVEAGAVLNW